MAYGYAYEMANEKYPVGTDIQMLESKDPAGTVPRLWIGKVIKIDELGNLVVRWQDSGRISKVDIARDGIDTA